MKETTPPPITYFLPGLKTISAARAAEILPAAFPPPDRLPVACRECFAGPDGAAGVLIAGGQAIPVYEPQAQTWTKIPPSLHHHDGDIWLGVPDSGVDPRDLHRRELIDGYMVPLADDNSWLVPTARIFPQGTAFPEALTLGPDGTVVRQALPQYAAACRDAERIFEAFRSDEGLIAADEAAPEPIDDADAFYLAAAALGINHRIGPAEAAALGLFTTANVRNVLICFVDLPAYAAAKKKSSASTSPPAEASESSGSGPPD